jgi:hypothetical protein
MALLLDGGFASLFLGAALLVDFVRNCETTDDDNGDNHDVTCLVWFVRVVLVLCLDVKELMMCVD